jgi:hypothetical protein
MTGDGCYRDTGINPTADACRQAEPERDFVALVKDTKYVRSNRKQRCTRRQVTTINPGYV